MVSKNMLINTALGTYKWIENWAKIPNTPSGQKNGRTHGVVVSENGQVIIAHQATPSILIYNQEGILLSSWGEFPGAHGLTLIKENDEEFLWLTDEFSSSVVKMSLDGKQIMSLPQPDHPDYQNGKSYIPTWVAQNPETGEIWVADGYGAYLVHQFSATGAYQKSINGTEGAGRFEEPHGIAFFYTDQGLELFITDRVNHRIVIYDAQGNFRRSSLIAHSPCGFHSLGNHILVPELFTGLKILDKHSLKLIEEIGVSSSVKPRPDGGWWPPVAPKDWPDLQGTEHIQPGIFNSPHAAYFASNHDIYVVEWTIGGRITKLEKQ